MNLGDYGEARFFLAVTTLITVIGMRFHGYLEETHFVELVSVVLGLYSAHQLADDKFPDRCGNDKA
jgi:hypothetical protein